MASFSFEDDLLVDDGLLDNSLATLTMESLIITFLVIASLDEFSLNDLDDLLTDDAEFASGNSAFNDFTLHDLDDFDLAIDHLRFAARLALNELSLDNFASSNLNQFDFTANALFRVASFFVVAFQANLLDRHAFLNGNNAVRFMEWRKEA